MNMPEDRTERSPLARNLLERFLPLRLELALRLVVKWPLSWPGQLRHFSGWAESFTAPDFFLERGHPWLPFDLVEWLEQYLEPDMSVWEFGSGGSTLFFARRAGDVIAVEHDPEWARRVRDLLTSEELDCVAFHVVEPHSFDPGSFGSGKTPYKEMSFEKYVRTVEEAEDNSLDCLVVDGRARSACVRHGREKVKNGGVLILDDVQRERYQSVVEKLSRDWGDPEIFQGLTPGARGPRPTALFHKP